VLLKPTYFDDFGNQTVDDSIIKNEAEELAEMVVNEGRKEFIENYNNNNISNE
jgi:hypothetical protein